MTTRALVPGLRVEHKARRPIRMLGNAIRKHRDKLLVIGFAIPSSLFHRLLAGAARSVKHYHQGEFTFGIEAGRDVHDEMPIETSKLNILNAIPRGDRRG